MSENAFETSLKSGRHQWLAQLEGKWKGTTKTWFEPGVLGDESPMEGTISPILGGRFMEHVYTGSMDGKPFTGKMLIGYDLNRELCTTAWVDSFHMSTGILYSEGTFRGQRFTALGHYHYGAEKWGWRTEIEVVASDRIVLTAYNISPAGEAAKATETVYERQTL